jgi:hypothetical protein
MGSYDLAVAYRIYPKVSKPASALPFGSDKYLLSEVCLRSFKESLGGLRVKVWVLLDGCPPEYGDLFRRYFKAEDIVFVELENVGNQATFQKQIDILLSQQEAEVVYFAEDDYFYLPQQFPVLLQFLNASMNVDFVSPCDYPDCFRLELHRHPISLALFERRYWSTAGSACLTFLTKRETLKATQHVFRTYSQGNHDCSLWLSLSKQSVLSPSKLWRCSVSKNRRAQARILAKAWISGWRQILFGRKRNLWMPIPGIATHLDADAIPPSVDWLSEISRQVESFRIPAFSK